MNHLNIIIISLVVTSEIHLVHATSTECRMLADVTDPHISQPEATHILRLYNLDQNPWDGARFQGRSITEMDYVKTYVATLPEIGFVERWLSNELERKYACEKFTTGIENIFEHLKHDTIGREHSSIYLAIAHDLNELSTSKADRKIETIFSDLMENSEFLSLYDSTTYVALKCNPDSVITVFKSQEELKDLTGIEVYLVYQPGSYEDNEPFRLISRLYKRMLEQKGAKVTICANLVFD